ncbi:hypothetical protein Cni_G01807 [Canna indica]|uniref:Uncharacterized protein n=1 Tax=Canna indica TaxID=4628 RepID=A0AAQ3Q1J3_9LILI|nr:hypothetical protein Cni_G01807 [Canna indica]
MNGVAMEGGTGRQLLVKEDTKEIDENICFQAEKTNVLMTEVESEVIKKQDQMDKLAESLTESFKKILENENAEVDFLEAGIDPELSRIGNKEGQKGRGCWKASSKLVNIPVEYNGKKIKKRRCSKECSALRDDGDPKERGSAAKNEDILK